MRKNLFYYLSASLLLLLSACLLTGCGDSLPENNGIPAERSSDAEQSDSDETSPVPSDSFHENASDTVTVFPKTEPFIDDTGKSIQRDGRCLYSFYSGRLICFDRETQQSTVLYQTASCHVLDFCLYGDDIYFVERTSYDSLDDRDTSLWRIGKDGGNLTLLQDDILNAETAIDQTNYSIDIYDNILYLLNDTHRYDDGDHIAETANLYFHLKNDGSVSEASEAETLYGMLPCRFSPADDAGFPSFPYAMRNYGYVFTQDSTGALYRMEPANGVWEPLALDADTINASRLALSGELAMLYSYHDGSISLYSLSDQRLFTADSPFSGPVSLSAVFPSEQGFFFCCESQEQDSPMKTSPIFTVLQISPDGSVNTLFSDTGHALGNGIPYTYDSCIDGDFLYYFCDEKNETDYSLMRLSLREEKNSAPEKLAVWPIWQTSSPATLRAERGDEKTMIGDTCSVSCSVKKLFLEEKTGADRRINQSLSEIYADFDTFSAEIIADEEKMLVEKPDLFDSLDYAGGYEFSLLMYLDYLDDDTISFCCYSYRHYASAAHGYSWYDYYVFDRQTGERLSFENFAGDASSILKTARPYLEKSAWDFDSQILSDISRFSLSEDGYTLYCAPYSSYLSGKLLITIPYEAFEKEL